MSIQEILPKKSILTAALIYVLCFVFYLYLLKACHHRVSFCGLALRNADAINTFIIVGLPLLIVFPLALLTYKMDERVYNSWIVFAAIFVPVVSFILFWISQQFINPLAGGSVIAFVIFLGILFFVISLTIILWRWTAIKINKKLSQKKR